PTARHEAACASGSIAALAASADIESERYGLACVVGVELMRNIPGAEVARHLGAAARVPLETEGVLHPWPALFSRVADVYAERFGLDRRHLVALARANFTNARRNPLAQTRRWTLDDDSFAEHDEKNPLVVGRVRRHDCSQITDGAAALVLASANVAARWARHHGVPLPRVPRLLGWGHRTARMSLEDKLTAGKSAYVFPHVHGVVNDALSRAELNDIYEIDAAEVHDCFSITHYMAIDHLGITPPGESWRAVEDGTVLRGGALPINPSGGLIGGGHPVGATGVRMLVDAWKQVTGRAGDCQVEKADRGRVLTLNLGGSATTAVSFVVGAQ
ncbi:MAG: thiolase domain-containing protein, partial [Myxococcales bacterium]|nr:thiolase domain-containing protein [Myxococcales bacterium]